MVVSDDKKKTALRRLAAFRTVAAQGLGSDRYWVLIDDQNKRTKRSNVLTLREIVGVEAGGMADLFGGEYQKLFKSGAGVGAGLLIDDYSSVVYVSALVDPSGRTRDCVPAKGIRIKRGSEGSKFFLEAIEDELRPIEATSTPKPETIGKRDADEVHLCTESPRRPYRDNKIIRRDNLGDIAASDDLDASPTSVLKFADDMCKAKWVEDIGAQMLIDHLSYTSNDRPPNKHFQHIAHLVLRNVEDTATQISKLHWMDKMNRQRTHSYQRLVQPRGCKTDALAKTQNELGEGNYNDEQIDEVFTKLARRRNMVVFHSREMQLTIAEIVAMRDHCSMSSNKMLKFKQAFERSRPKLKSVIFPPSLFARMTELEREGSLPITVKKLPLVTKKEGSKMDLRHMWYVSEAAKMVEKLVNQCVADGKFQESISFSNLLNQLVVVWGIDKSAKDTGLAARIGNRENGNSRDYTQLLGAVENAVENYSNMKATFFSDDCPLKAFLQALMYDRYQMLVVQVGSQCQSFMFNPFPYLKPCTTRNLEAELVGDVDQDDAEFDNEPTNGLPPDVPMLSRNRNVGVRLVVHDEEDGEGKEIVGFQLEVDSIVAYSQLFSSPMRLAAEADIKAVTKVSIMQVNGHIASDLKQLLIETGIISATAMCSCVTCVRPKSQFGIPSERLQRISLVANVF